MAFHFNPNTTERSSFELLPVGHYGIQCVKMERVWNDAGNFMIKAEFEIMTPEASAGRRVFENFNLLHHTSDMAQKIGREKLAEFCDAIAISELFQGDGIDLEAISDDELSELFCFKLFDGKVGVQKDKSGQYKDQNRINEYKIAGSSQAPARPVGGAPQGAVNPSTARQTRNEGAAPTSAAAAPNGGQRPPPSGGSRPWDRAAAGR